MYDDLLMAHVRPRSMLVTNTTGDPNVTIATGYALARAAGIVPFLPADAPPHLANFRAPANFAAGHPGFASPNDAAPAPRSASSRPATATKLSTTPAA